MTPTDKTAIEAEAEEFVNQLGWWSNDANGFLAEGTDMIKCYLAGYESCRTKSVEAETPHFNKIDDQQTRIKEIDDQADCIQEILDILLVGTKSDVINRYKIIRVKDLKLDSLEQPKKGDRERLLDWLLERKASYKDKPINDEFINGRFWECHDVIQFLQANKIEELKK